MQRVFVVLLCLFTVLLGSSANSHALQVTNNLYFPHVASGANWETEIGIINTGEMTLEGVLYAYDSDGSEVENENLTLASGARAELAVGLDFNNPTQISYITFEYNSEASCSGYEKFYVAGQRVAIPAVSSTNTDTIYISHIASNANWWTGFALVNTTAEAKTLTFTFNDGPRYTLFLDAGCHWSGTLAGSFPELDAQNVESATITNASGIIGLELFGSTPSSGSHYLSGILLTDQTTNILYYPHVASDANWWTGIVSYNPSSATTLTITPYTATGQALTTSSIVVQEGGKYIGTVAGLNLPEGTAWFKVDATSPISGFELFGQHDGSQLAGYSAVNIKTKQGTFVKTDKEGWTGIAFVNTEDETTTVNLTALDDSGNIIASTSKELVGNGKQVNLAEAFFSPGDISDATYIQFVCNIDIVGFQLNSSNDSMMLDGLPGLAVTSTAATPVFSPDSGAVAFGTNVTISTTTSGATIYYTTDGSSPTTSSTEYTEPVEISSAVTLKAIAAATGYTNSFVASATYTQSASDGLTGLVLSGSPSNYTFTGSIYSYTGITVGSAVSSLTVTPTGLGTITVNGSEVSSGNNSGAIALTAGVEETIAVVVTESGKTAKTYTLKVTRDLPTVFYPLVAGAWSAPALVDDSTGSKSKTQVAINDAGDMVAVWLVYDNSPSINNVYGSHYNSASEVWTSPVLLETIDFDAAQLKLAIDATGNAVAVWTMETGGFNSIYANRFDANTGLWGTALELDTTVEYTEAPDVGMDDAGNAIVVWLETLPVTNYESVKSRRFDSSGSWIIDSWSSVVDLASGDVEYGDPRVAVNSAGDAVAIWNQPNQTTVAARRYSPTAGWDTSVTFASNLDYLSDINLAIDAQDNIVVVWSQSNGSVRDLYANYLYDGDSIWDGVASLENLTTTVEDFHVAMDGNGNAFAIWTHLNSVFGAPANRDVYTSRYDVLTGWGTPEQIDSDTANINEVAIAMDSSGNALAQGISGDTVSRAPVVNRYNAATSTWSGTEVLAPGGRFSSLAANSSGQAVLAWVNGVTDPDTGDYITTLYISLLR